MGNKVTRDPAAKKRAVVDAAADLLLEIGPNELTHRKIAARAGVSLGITTHYFATKQDIEIAAIQQLADRRNDAIAQLQAEMAAAKYPETVVAKRLYASMLAEPSSRPLLIYMATNCNDPRTAEFVQAWFEATYQEFLKLTSEAQARAVANYADGLFMQHAIRHAKIPSYREILHNIRLLMGREDIPEDEDEEEPEITSGGEAAIIPEAHNQADTDSDAGENAQ